MGECKTRRNSEEDEEEDEQGGGRSWRGGEKEVEKAEEFG